METVAASNSQLCNPTPVSNAGGWSFSAGTFHTLSNYASLYLQRNANPLATCKGRREKELGKGAQEAWSRKVERASEAQK